MDRTLCRTRLLVIGGLVSSLHAFGRPADSATSNQYCTAVLKPPDYWTFRPPPAGETFRDPVFGTEIEVITDDHCVVGFNGERSNFSRDDRYFFTGLKLAPDRNSEVRLFDGRTGRLIKPLRIEKYDAVRWGYAPRRLVCIGEKELRAYDVETDRSSLIEEFPEVLGDGKGRIAGGDGNDFDDAGEWLLLNYGPKCRRMFAYNVRTRQRGPEHTFPEETSVDYATMTPSGRYILVLFRLTKLRAPRYRGLVLYDREWNFIRQLVPSSGHIELGYLNGTDECVIAKIGKGLEEWRAQWGLNPRDRLAARFSDGKIIKLLDRGTIYWQGAAVGGSNRRYVYMAFESDNLDPEKRWQKYAGEILEVPLDGSMEVRRLLHHRCRPSVSDERHTWADQPELWINHAGDRLFFRSNMFLRKGSTGQKYGHDLFLVKIPPRQR